jgi:hypothetical protein
MTSSVFLFAKILQAIGFAHVGIGLYLGVAQDDMWKELYLGLSGLAFFAIGRLLEPRT